MHSCAHLTVVVVLLQEEDAALLLQWKPQMLRVLLQHAQHLRASILAESLLQRLLQQQEVQVPQERQEQQEPQDVVELLLRQLVDWLQQHCTHLDDERHAELQEQHQQQEHQQQQQQQKELRIPLPVLLDVACGFVDAFLPVSDSAGLGFMVWHLGIGI